MEELDAAGIPLDSVLQVELQRAARAKEILLCGVDIVSGDAAVIREVAVDIRGPRILREHLDVHDSVVRRPGGHRGAEEEVEEAEVPLRLCQPRWLVEGAFMEGEESPDQRLRRLHVQDVRDAGKSTARGPFGTEDGRRPDGGPAYT